MGHRQLSEQLKSKSIKQLIITSIAKDLNHTPLLAEAYFNQIKDYFLHHENIDLSSGQLHYLPAISESIPNIITAIYFRVLDKNGKAIWTTP